MSDKICRICKKYIEGTAAITCHFPYRDPPFTEYDCFECSGRTKGSPQIIIYDGDHKFNLIRSETKDVD